MTGLTQIIYPKAKIIFKQLLKTIIRGLYLVVLQCGHYYLQPLLYPATLHYKLHQVLA